MVVVHDGGMTNHPTEQEVAATPPLKPYTKYYCPNDTGGVGHSSIWTGAYRNPRPEAGWCMCGTRFVEEPRNDGTHWRLSWEMSGPFDPPGVFHPASRETSSEHDARQQLRGLAELADQGEPIRNIRLEKSVSAWVEVDR